jgi:hypothetical protein
MRTDTDVGVGVGVDVEEASGVAVGMGVSVDVGVGDAEQTFKAALLLRGLGAPALKSVELLSVSVQPLVALNAAVVLLKEGATLPSEQLVPVP